MNDGMEHLNRWEQRNRAALIAEELADAEVRRKSRVVSITRIDLMAAILREAAFRTAVALGIPPHLCCASLVPDPETKRYRPAIDIDSSMTVDPAAVSQVFGFAFAEVRQTWAFDVAYAEHDALYAPAMAEGFKAETLPAFAQRVASWLSRG